MSALDVRTWALVDAARDGDADAFGLLYRQYRDKVLRELRRLTGDPVLAEDLASETFLRAFVRLGTCTHRRGSFRGWLLTIARRLVLDEWKSVRHRRVTVGLDAAAEPAAQDDPAAETCRGETRALVRGLLGGLTPLQRECLTMRFLLGLSVARTAAQLGRSPAAVRALQFRAMRDFAGSEDARRVVA